MKLEALARKVTKAGALVPGVFAGKRPEDIVMLLYHRVGTGEREIDLPTAMFEQQIAWLSSNGAALSIDAAFASNGRGGVVVTIDDGFRDFYEVALPLLIRYRVPAILYLATGLVANGSGSNDPDALHWRHLEEAAASGLVTIGAHTHGHADLSRASAREAEDEMRKAQELIEDKLGVSCRHFAYPWAVGSPAADRVARRLFDSAALGWSTNRRGRYDIHRLGRTPILRNDGRTFFRAKVAGRLDAEASLYRILRRGPWRQR